MTDAVLVHRECRVHGCGNVSNGALDLPVVFWAGRELIPARVLLPICDDHAAQFSGVRSGVATDQTWPIE